MNFKTNYKDEIPANGKRLYGLVDKNGAYVNRDVQIVRTNANTQEGDTFGAAEVNKIGGFLNDTSNDNIIINGDFRVWQRDTIRPSVASGSYCADRWTVYCPSGTMSFQKVENGLKVTAGNGGIYQPVSVNEYGWLLGKTCTVQICKNDVVTSFKRTMERDNGTDKIVVAPVNDLKTNDIVNWVKVEIGEFATPFAPNTITEELGACKKYGVFYRPSYYLNLMMGTYYDGKIVGMLLANNLRISPTCNFTGRLLYYAVNGKANVEDTPSTISVDRYTGYATITPGKTTGFVNGDTCVIQMYPNSRIDIDAEIY